MATTLRLTATDETKPAFDSLNRNLDETGDRAADAGVAVDDVANELKARRAREYAAAVKAAADELDGTAEKARQAAAETERLAKAQEDQDRRSEAASRRAEVATAAATGGNLVLDILKAIPQAVSEAREHFRELAEEGNAGAALMTRKWDDAALALRAAWKGFFEDTKGETTFLAEYIASIGWGIQDVTEKLAGVSAEEARREKDRAAAREQTAKAEAELAANREKWAEEDRKRESDRVLALREFDRSETEIVLASEGRHRELHELRMQWIDEELSLALKAAKDEGEAAAASDRAQAARDAELHAEKMRIFQEEREAERKDAEEAADLARERAEAEKKAAEEAGKEVVRLAKEVEEAKTAAAEAEAERRRMAEETRARHLKAMQEAVASGGGDVAAAVQQVREGRIRQAQEDFLAGGGGRGLSQAELRREMQRIVREETRRTTMDARANRLHTDELAAAQEKIAGLAGQQVERSAAVNDVTIGALQAAEERLREAEARLQEQGRQLQAIQQSMIAGARRTREQRRSLAG